MRAFLLPLLMLCLPAFGAGADMQWQAPRILPPKGEAPASATSGASAAAASAASAGVASSGASANAASGPTKAQSGAPAKEASPARPATPADKAGSASAPAKSASAPELAAKIKEKLEATQQPAPKHARTADSRGSSSFMTQDEFRARLAAAAAQAKSAAASAPPPPKPRVAKLKSVSVAPRPASALHWSYAGAEGPEHWGDMASEWARCGNGKRQSPIDIRDGFKLELEAPLFEYQPSRFAVLDNGHTIQVNINTPNFTSLMGRRFQLVQFHFHRPSEERIEGRGYEMVVHLVHKDEEGRLMVMAVMIERGEANAQVQQVWNNLPLEKNETLTPSIRLDVMQMLPARREYYTYMGSLTTPPCSEGVLWVVMKQPITLSEQQIRIFARLYPMNARPLQAAGDRLIKESN